MSSKSPHHTKAAKKLRADTEWEKLRNECAWSRLNEMAKLAIEKAGDKPGDSVDVVVRFLLDESQLELYAHGHELLGERSEAELQQIEALEKRFHEALFRNELNGPGEALSSTANNTLKIEATVLRSKALFLQRRFEEAQSVLNSVQLRSVDIANAASVSLNYLRLVLDAHAIRALSIEQLAVAKLAAHVDSNADQEADWTLTEATTKQVDAALQAAVDALIVYAFEFDRRVSEAGAALAAFECNTLARTALDRAAFASARQGTDSVARQVSRLRDLLRGDLRVAGGGAAQSLRAHAAAMLGRLLVRHVSDASFDAASTSAGGIALVSTAPGLAEPQSPGTAALHKVHTTPALTPTGTQPTGAQSRGRARLAISEQPSTVPRTLSEELILLLSIAECLTKRNVVISRARELAEQRRATFEHAVDVLDTLTVVCVRNGAYEPLAERFERAAEYSFNEPHVWRAFALTLVESGQPYRAYLVLREWRRMQPQCALVCSLLARLCLEQLASSSAHFVDEALECARSAARSEPANARSQLLVGLGCAMKARSERVREERDALQRDALTAFQTACSLDPYDALAAYHVALAHALARNLKEAASFSARAARLNPDCWYAVQLCVLVLSARREFDDAARLSAQLVEDWPSVLPLYVTKARLARLFNKKAADCLQAGLQRANSLFKECFDAAFTVANTATDSRCSPTVPATPQYVTLPRGTQQPGTNASKAESPFADVAGQSGPSSGPAQPSDKQSVRSDNYAPSAFGGMSLRDCTTQIDVETERVFVEACRALAIYLRLAAELVDCYTLIDRLDSARRLVADCELLCARCCTCVETSLNELYNLRCLALLDYMRGLVLENARDCIGAKDAYLAVVLSGEADVSCLQHLCTVLMETGQFQLAEKYIRDAIAIEPQSSRSWEKLGLVLQTVGQHESAIDCFTRAIELSQTEPIEPFSTLPLPAQ